MKLFKFQTFAPAERAIKKKFLLGKLFFYQYESIKPSGFKIREMTATSFGRFYMESTSVISLKFLFFNVFFNFSLAFILHKMGLGTKSAKPWKPPPR